MSSRLLPTLDRLIGRVCSVAYVLVLPVSLLLFMQWPLREIVQSYSREANDLAQWLFAIYVSLAIVHATRTHTHLAADAVSNRYSARRRRTIARLGALIVLVPWSIYLLHTSLPMIWQSVSQIERFPETYNPGYFIIKLAVGLLGVLVLLQSIVEVFKADS